MMGNTQLTPVMFETNELTELVCKYGTIQSFYLAQDIAEAFQRIESRLEESTYKRVKLYSVLFEVGRVQGMREERARRRLRGIKAGGQTDVRTSSTIGQDI